MSWEIFLEHKYMKKEQLEKTQLIDYEENLC